MHTLKGKQFQHQCGITTDAILSTHVQCVCRARIMLHGSALTLERRWCTLVLRGYKTLELRGYSCHVRGSVALLASKDSCVEGCVQILERIWDPVKNPEQEKATKVAKVGVNNRIQSSLCGKHGTA